MRDCLPSALVARSRNSLALRGRRRGSIGLGIVNLSLGGHPAIDASGGRAAPVAHAVVDSMRACATRARASARAARKGKGALRMMVEARVVADGSRRDVAGGVTMGSSGKQQSSSSTAIATATAAAAAAAAASSQQAEERQRR